MMMDTTEDIVFTLQVPCAVVPLDTVCDDNTPPALNPPTSSKPKPPPDLTSIGDNNILIVMALLDNVFGGYIARASQQNIMGLPSASSQSHK